MPPEDALRFLGEAKVARFGTVGPDGYPYVVPKLYVFMDGAVFFHGSSGGHFAANVAHNPRLCLEIDESGEVYSNGNTACDTGIAYRSVIAFGTVQVVSDPDEKTRALDALMAKYADPAWHLPAGVYPQLGDVTVYRMSIEQMTGKVKAVP